MLLGFLRSTRAGATAITAAGVTLMTVMGTAIIVDHSWLVGKRDILKAASDAGAVAATIRLRELPKTLNDETLLPILQEVAERYVWINLASNLPDETFEKEDVVVTLTVDRPKGIVNANIVAPIGKPLLAKIVNYFGPEQLSVNSGAKVDVGAVWAVLALDSSQSMRATLSGELPDPTTSSRIRIVKAAAKEFVDALHLNTESGTVKIGLVVWSHDVDSWTPMTSTKQTIKTAIDSIRARGSGTSSSQGLKKSRDLLISAPDGTQKVIVLLTDGADNVDIHNDRCPRRSDCSRWRKTQCTRAKDEGVKVFTIGAMEDAGSELAQQLSDCASASSYAFTDHANPQAMHDTFSQITGHLRPLRRTH